MLIHKLRSAPALTFIIPALTALLCILALPPFSIPGLGWVCLLPMLYFLQSSRIYPLYAGITFAIAISSYCFLGAWTYSIPLFFIIVVIASAGQSLFWWCSHHLITTPYIGTIAIACLWTAMEFTLHVLGLPFSLTAALTALPGLLQFADIGGQYLIVFVAVLAQTWLAKLLWKRSIPAGLPFVGLLVALWAYNFLLLPPYLNTTTETLTVAVIQTNLTPAQIANAHQDNGLEELQRTRTRWISKLQANGAVPSLVVWPEIAFSGFEFRAESNVAAQARGLSANMLVFSPDLLPDRTLRNAVFGINQLGNIVSRREKSILVPFAETDFSEGRNLGPHQALPHHPASLICLESALPEIARKTVKGAGLISIITNDAYTGPTILPLLHFELARLRAIESRKPVLRAANGGRSAVIDAQGRVTDTLDLYTAGILTTTIDIHAYQSIYQNKGYLIGFLIIGLGGVVFLVAMYRISTSPALPKLAIDLIPAYLMATLLLTVLLIGLQVLVMKTSDNHRASSVAPPQFNSLKVNQRELSGISAVTYLLRRHGFGVTLAQIKDKLATQQNTLYSDHEFESLLKPYGFALQRFDYKHENSKISLFAPSLVQLRNGEYVVLSHIGFRTVTLFRPLLGKEIQVTRKAFLDTWNGKLLTLAPMPNRWDLQ